MIFDLHNDFPTVIAPQKYSDHIDCLPKGVTVTGAIWTTEFGGNAEQKVVEITDRLTALAKRRVRIAIEDVGFLCDNERYRTFDFSKYIYCSLCWNRNNGFAGGALDDGELTDNGRRAIVEINKSGCAVDLAHLNRKSFYAVLDSAERVVCSHTGFNGHLRSLDAGQISALIARGSIIGLCTVSTFSGANNAEEFANVIDGFVQKYGAQCLAIGTDFYGSADIPNDINDYDGIFAVKDVLLSRGYDKSTVEQIFYNNANSFFTEINNEGHL